MEEWLSEFQAWFAEEDDYCSFAQELLQEFYNWETEEEQAYPEITDEFLIKTFQGLHLLVQKTLDDRIEAEDNQEFAQELCQEFSSWTTQQEENEHLASMLKPQNHQSMRNITGCRHK